MEMYKTEIFIDILTQSKIGKNLKLFIDFCKDYNAYLPELQNMSFRAEQTQMKWKNYIN